MRQSCRVTAIPAEYVFKAIHFPPNRTYKTLFKILCPSNALVMTDTVELLEWFTLKAKYLASKSSRVYHAFNSSLDTHSMQGIGTILIGLQMNVVRRKVEQESRPIRLHIDASRTITGAVIEAS